MNTVAYFLVTRLIADERAEITRKVIDFVTTSGVHIIGLTFDGLLANISMCKALNADVFNNRLFFIYPSRCLWYFYIFRCHTYAEAFKTCFCIEKSIDGQGRVIDFEYIENLVKLQESGGFHLRNKLNRKHVKWYRNQINVNLVAQTLSESLQL